MKLLKDNCIKALDSFFLHTFQKFRFYDQRWEVHDNIKREVTMLERIFNYHVQNFEQKKLEEGKN